MHLEDKPIAHFPSASIISHQSFFVLHISGRRTMLKLSNLLILFLAASSLHAQGIREHVRQGLPKAAGTKVSDAQASESKVTE